jgi:ABC-type transporter MlaC component
MNLKLRQLSIAILSTLAFSAPAYSEILGQRPTTNSALHRQGNQAKLSKQDEQVVKKIIDDYFDQISNLQREIGAVRGNFRISNAEKRKILPSFKLRVDNMINSHIERLRPYSSQDKNISRILEFMRRNGEFHLYYLLECPDMNGATMCFNK